MAGAKVRFVPLEFKDNKWSFNKENLLSVLSDKSKVLILNNAQNPTGKLFTREELELVSEIIKSYPNLVVLSDDVYEYLVFDGKETILFASIGDNWHKTISVFSGGKLFSATGWKVGWGIGPADLINAASIVSTATVYCINAPAQIAMSRSLGEVIETHDYKEGLSYLAHSKKEFEKVRDFMVEEFSKPYDL